MRLPNRRITLRQVSFAQRDALSGAYSSLQTEAWSAARQGHIQYARLVAERARALVAAFTKPVPRRRSA